MDNNEAVIPRSWGNGSNRIAALNVQGTSPPSCLLPNSNGQPSVDKDFDDQSKPGWKKFLYFVGPGFLISLAYLDPANCTDSKSSHFCFQNPNYATELFMLELFAVEADLQAGASYGYNQLWVILIGLVFALIIQSLAVNLGVATGKHLAELCRAEYPTPIKYCLWLLTEFAVINADVPVWIGVLMTGLSTLLLLGFQRYGVTLKQLLICMMVFILAACFFGEMGYAKPPAGPVMKGLFIPRLAGHGAVGNAIALIGALVMPHNLFLHSALVLSRKVPRSVRGINEACKYFLLETGFALFVALLINIAVVSVSGSVCSGPNISSETVDNCNSITLDSASFLLKNVLGRSASTIYGISLLASGQSSAITGTYAGQFVMQGFLDLKMQLWKRNLITRSIAIVPSLIVSTVSGPSGAGRLVIIASADDTVV